jgi:hypothetical protein
MSEVPPRANKEFELMPVLASSPEVLTVAQYQQLAHATDRTAARAPQHLNFPLLELFGEAGSLLSELKKKQREDALIPEFIAFVGTECGAE